MEVNYYEFVREEDEEFSYSFSSETSLYNIVFNPHEYNEYLDTPNDFYNNCYTLSIFSFRHDLSDSKIPHDNRVKLTINIIIQDFYNQVDDNTILIYQLLDSDNKRYVRHRMFNIWEKQLNDGRFYKYDYDVNTLAKSEKTGFICKANQDVEKLKKEFIDNVTVITKDK